jgi:uncharacterized membrane protein
MTTTSSLDRRNLKPELPSPRPIGEAQVLHKPLFIAFLLWFAVNWIALVLKTGFSGGSDWAEGALLIGAAATLLVGLARRLPVQNVLMAAISIAALSILVACVGIRTGIPFGAFSCTDRMGVILPGSLPWPIPLIWLVAILSSRGVARLIARPWRKTNYYGFWVIGLTVVFVLNIDLGLEPYATAWKRYWIWNAPASVPTWYGAPWANFLGWGVTALGIVVLTTPWLINKQPVKQPTDYHPLLIWLLANIYFATANGLRGYWLAVGLCSAITVAAAAFAIRAGHWCVAGQHSSERASGP